jgi:hypothetical protein
MSPPQTCGGFPLVVHDGEKRDDRRLDVGAGTKRRKGCDLRSSRGSKNYAVGLEIRCPGGACLLGPLNPQSPQPSKIGGDKV